MNKKWIILIITLIGAVWAMGYTDWHVNRNVHNLMPSGELQYIDSSNYMDSSGLVWILQPYDKNIFHQPEQARIKPNNPYPNINTPPSYDPENSNLKFLSITESGSSYEAILQPNGEYLIDGSRQGTYNYSHPDGFLGNMIHVIIDILPHLINSDYAH